MESEFGARRASAAFRPHFERLFASDAELKLALNARKVHATSAGEGVTKFARRTRNAVLFQMAFETFALVIGVVLFLPSCKVLAADTFVLGFPL